MIFLFTNRMICGENALLLKIREASLAGVDFILLRENDMCDISYKKLALSALQMMTGTKTELVICHRNHIADELKLRKHNSYHNFHMDSFTVSIHHKNELQNLGEKMFFYSPIFETKCKPGAKLKGTGFSHPNMIALGGIKLNRLSLLEDINHIGVMSEWLEVKDTFELIQQYRKSGY